MLVRIHTALAFVCKHAHVYCTLVVRVMGVALDVECVVVFRLCD